MNVRTDRLFPIAVLALLAALTFWLERLLTAEQRPTPGKQRHDPDFIVEKASVRRLGPDGTLQQSMVAEKMVHFPDDNSTELVRPRLTYHSRTPIIHLSSNWARVTHDSKVVTLVDEVLALQEATGANPELRMTTSELIVYPDDEQAVTDKPVRIVQGASVATGTGMILDNRLGTVVLQSRVQATIDTRKH